MGEVEQFHISRGKGIFYLIFLLLFIPTPFFALDPSIPINQYINNIITTKDGLPQNTIYDIIQDKYGYIWIGTDRGAARFDGKKFVPFDQSNTKGIKNNSITSLLLSSDGSLWLGTFGGGVSIYKNNRFKNYSTKNRLSNDFIWTIKEDRNKNIWMGTTGGGLVCYKNNTFRTFTVKEGLSDNIVKAIFEDSRGNLWIGTENGLNRMNTSTFILSTTTLKISDNNVMSIFEDSKGILWIGTINGLTGFNVNNLKAKSIKPQLPNNMIRSILEDRDRNLWVATDGGLVRIRENKIETYSTTDGLSDNSVMKIFEDQEGNLWISTSGQGLNILHNGKFFSYTTKEGLALDHIKAIYEDEKGYIWIGTLGGGLNVKIDKTIQTYTIKDGLNSNLINTIYGDSDGRLWIGSNKGLNQFKNGILSTFYSDIGPIEKSVISLYEDSKKNMWIGTYGGGVNIFNDGKLTVLNTGHGLSNDFVLSITEDQQENLWIGTNKGLNRYKDNRFKIYLEEHGLSNETIFDIYADADGVLWIGTNGGGLNRFENETFTIYTTEAGLYNNVIYRIIEDNRRNLWMSSNNGIFSISKRELNEFASGQIPRINCRYFQEDDGLKSSVCTGGFQPAGWKTKKGDLWFPTIRSIAVINPSRIKLNKRKPPIYIEEIRVDGIRINPHEDLVFNAGTNKIEIQFTALSFTAPSKVKFSYKLFGHKKKWTETYSREKIIYSNLPSGKYKFKVIACNNDGIWNYKGASVSFRIKFRFYQTLGFYILAAVILSLLLFGILKSREIWLVKIAEQNKKYKQSTLSRSKSQQYLQKLLKLMKEEKPYTDEDITLDSLAERLSISKKHLSQIINEQLNQNFKNFINKFRVEEAKRKILDPNEMDFVILKIAYDVGFKSKSVFNTAFKKFTKMSPSEYRKKHQKKVYSEEKINS